MPSELMICVPGPWQDSRDFIRAVITAEPMGRWMFAGMVLADVQGKEHVAAELEAHYPDMGQAFGLAGHGKIPDSVLSQVAAHKSAVYLRFSLPLQEERARILKFSRFLQTIGGIAVKVESAGVAHTWERWFSLLESENPFDWYCASVVLVGDKDFYYSCGMHHFQLADAEISTQLSAEVAAETLNQFNYWRLSQNPHLEAGHTFSLSRTSPYFELESLPDSRHDEDDFFHNPDGLWRLNQK